MERELSIKIKYHWKQVDGSDVIPHHIPYLEEHAADRIPDMLNEGYTSGELLDTIHTQEDPADHEGTDYRGWWSL